MPFTVKHLQIVSKNYNTFPLDLAILNRTHHAESEVK